MALQADYAKLQAAYQAMKRQSAHPAAAMHVAAPAPPSDSFLKLQVLLAATATSWHSVHGVDPATRSQRLSVVDHVACHAGILHV